jgi:hypothetical protein
MNALGMCRHNNLGNYCPSCVNEKRRGMGDDVLSSVLSTVEGGAITTAENASCNSVMNFYQTNPALAYGLTAAIAIFAIYGALRLLEAAFTGK